MNVRLRQINNTVNGNPRYIFHFSDIAETYVDALILGEKILGARAYNAKPYEGCLVFTSYSPITAIKHGFNKTADITCRTRP